jgi:hypothetical protein
MREILVPASQGNPYLCARLGFGELLADLHYVERGADRLAIYHFHHVAALDTEAGEEAILLEVAYFDPVKETGRQSPESAKLGLGILDLSFRGLAAYFEARAGNLAHEGSGFLGLGCEGKKEGEGQE